MATIDLKLKTYEQLQFEVNRLVVDNFLKQQKINEYKEQIQNISNEFLKYDWENSTKEQIVNQLKSLYTSIFKNGGDEE